ncbi:MAG: hypothetical protein ACO307_02025 [Ilumatobacteraceae bacterium]
MAETAPSAPTDLEQILGYQGAVDDHPDADHPEVERVADELHLLRFWTPSFCATVIRAAEATGAFEPHPDDPVPGFEVSLAVISPRLFEAVQVDIGTRVWPRLQEIWPLIEYRGLRDAFVIRYRAGEQESLRLHQDIAQISATVRLNDGYRGADLHFPRQGYVADSMPVGSMLVWPSLVTHPHEATPLESGVKYGLTVWCELPDDSVVW